MIAKLAIAAAIAICLAAPFFIPHGGLVTIGVLLAAAIWSGWGAITRLFRTSTTKEALPPEREGQ